MVAPAAAIEPTEESRPSILRRIGAGVACVFATLLWPDRAVPRSVSEGRYGAALLAVILTSGLAAAAIGLRIDVTPLVLPDFPPPGAGDALGAPKEDSSTVMSDRELADKADTRRKIEQVMLGLGAGLGNPVKLFALALGLYLLGRYVGGKPTVRRTMAAATHAALPGAVKSCIVAVAVFRRATIVPAELEAVVLPSTIAPASSPVATRLLAGVDPFLLWSVVLLGLGFATAAQVSRKKAFFSVVVVFLLFLAITRGILGGLAPPGAAK